MTTPPVEDAWRRDAVEPSDKDLDDLARELVDRNRQLAAWWDRPTRRSIHYQTARWALVHAGSWADEETLAKLRAAIRNVEDEKDAAARACA